MKIYSKILIALILFAGFVFFVGDVAADDVSVSISASPTSGDATLNVGANGNISVDGVSCATYRIHCWTGDLSNPLRCDSGGVSRTCTYPSAGTYVMNIKAWLPNDSCSPPQNYCGIDVDSVTINVSNPAPPPPANNFLPRGSLDAATCDFIAGWADDRDNLSRPIYVHLYANGVFQPPQILANSNRADVGDHAFHVPTPDSLKDGTDKVIRVYGINIRADGVTGGTNVELPGSPKTINCPPPPPPLAWNINVSGVPLSGPAPLDVVVAASEATGSTATGSTTWIFNCGDGSGDKTYTTADGVNLKTDICPYSTQGIYTVVVSATRQGLTDSGTVTINVSEPVAPTVQLLDLTEPDYCTSSLGITAQWDYDHPINPQERYRIQIDDTSNFSSLVFDTNWITSTTDSKYIRSGSQPVYLISGDLLYGNEQYYVRIAVRDDKDIASEWSNVLTWTTPNGPLPQPDFTWEPEQIVEEEEIQFTDLSNPNPITYSWLFGDGNSSTDANPTHTYELDGNKSVTLTVGAGGAETCSTTEDLDVKEKPPIWKEILPNLFFSVELYNSVRMYFRRN